MVSVCSAVCHRLDVKLCSPKTHNAPQARGWRENILKHSCNQEEYTHGPLHFSRHTEAPTQCTRCPRRTWKQSLQGNLNGISLDCCWVVLFYAEEKSTSECKCYCLCLCICEIAPCVCEWLRLQIGDTVSVSNRQLDGFQPQR